MKLIRILDILFATVGLLILSPVFIIISLLIILESKGGVFFLQTRVGKNGNDFSMFKFRSMAQGSDKKGLLTVGMHDSRITKIGRFIRKYKVDELPQLINVFMGNMSIVGPRPEVKKYVDLYNSEQIKILNVKPGITDLASIQFSNENEILAKSSEPEKKYIEEIMPAKIIMNMEYINNRNIKMYFKIILLTVKKIIV